MFRLRLKGEGVACAGAVHYGGERRQRERETDKTNRVRYYKGQPVSSRRKQAAEQAKWERPAEAKLQVQTKRKASYCLENGARPGSYWQRPWRQVTRTGPQETRHRGAEAVASAIWWRDLAPEDIPRGQREIERGVVR